MCIRDRVKSVTRINNRKIGTGKIGHVTKELQKSFMDVVMGQDKRFVKWLKFL